VSRNAILVMTDEEKLMYLEGSEHKTSGRTFLFDDKRSQVVVADNGLKGGSCFRHLIWERERARRRRRMKK